MSNFTFIKADYPELCADAAEVERLTFDSPPANGDLLSQHAGKCGELAV